MKKILSVRTALIYCLSLFLFPLSSLAQDSSHVPGDVIVMFHNNVSHQSLNKSIFQETGLESKLTHRSELSKLSNIHLFHFDYSQTDERTILEAIRKSPLVRAAQFNHYVKERQIPNDPQIGSQWHHVDGSDNDIDSDLAWDITTGGTTTNGDEIVVCVIEPGGANYNHVDLAANHWVNSGEIPNNGVDDDGNGYVDDYDGWDPTSNTDNISNGGHGTAVSGMIGAVGNNNNGGAGVNWNVKIMQVEVGSLTESNVIASYSYPQTMRDLYNTSGGSQGAFVVATNASWGIDFANPANYPVWCAYYDDLGSVGILNCGATANNNVDIDAVGDMPTACGSDYMVAVTASNSNDQRTFSGYGAATIDLAAPGESVYLPSGSTGYSGTSGTSFASPCVAGAIALVYSAPCSNLAATAISNPQLAADLVRGYIFDGVDPVAGLSNETVTGGRLNVKNALDLAIADCGPPPVCDPLDISLSTDCAINEGSGQVEASITVSALFESDFCSATRVCYQISGGSLSCIDLGAGELSNQFDFTISGLESNSSYTVYYETSEGPSASEQITTPDCASLTAGCTDQEALNYNPSADIDDGSCSYPCEQVTLTIDTDCWGNEVSWEIVNESGTIVASVNNNTYNDETQYTWSECLEAGCYTFNIFDSFGDGMNGSAYSFCGIDGDYQMTDASGSVLFEMAQADYGSQATHTFCVDGGGTPPCENPYPQVSGLSSTVQSNGVLLEWNPISGSVGCQIQGGLLSGGFVSINVLQPEASVYFVNQGSLQSGQTYQWRVRCACSTSPIIAGPWSEFDQFTFGGARASLTGSDLLEEKEIKLLPNPTSGSTQLIISSVRAGAATITVFDLTGKAVYQENVALSEGENARWIDLEDHPVGLYLIQIQNGEEIYRSKLVLK